MEQELLTLPEHLSSHLVFSGVRVTRSLVLYVCFVDRCFSFCPFSFGHCVVCHSSTYGFWLPSDIFKLFLSFLFVIVFFFLRGSESAGFFLIVCLYLFALSLHWRSNYQEGEGWVLINGFNSATFLCMTQSRPWISNVIHVRRGLFVFNDLRWETIVHFVDLRGRNCWPSLFELSCHNKRI
jgi:hypothetical protein